MDSSIGNTLLEILCCISLLVAMGALGVVIWSKRKGNTPVTADSLKKDLERKMSQGKVGDLILALDSQDDRVRKAAAEVLLILVTFHKDNKHVAPYLKIMIEQLIKVLKAEPDPTIRENILLVLMLLQEKAIEPLREAQRNSSGAARIHLTSVLASDSIADADEIIEALKDADPAVRRAAAEDIGPLGDQRAVTPLTEALNDPDLTVREAASEALNRLATMAARQEALKKQAQ